MIKPGQIYEWSALDARFVVCNLNYSEITIDGDVIKTLFSITCKANNGYTYMFLSDSSKEWNLIAEYPSWQEAVNSKEFKGEVL